MMYKVAQEKVLVWTANTSACKVATKSKNKHFGTMLSPLFSQKIQSIED